MVEADGRFVRPAVTLLARSDVRCGLASVVGEVCG